MVATVIKEAPVLGRKPTVKMVHTTTDCRIYSAKSRKSKQVEIEMKASGSTTGSRKSLMKKLKDKMKRRSDGKSKSSGSHALSGSDSDTITTVDTKSSAGSFEPTEAAVGAVSSGSILGQAGDTVEWALNPTPSFVNDAKAFLALDEITGSDVEKELQEVDAIQAQAGETVERALNLTPSFNCDAKAFLSLDGVTTSDVERDLKDGDDSANEKTVGAMKESVEEVEVLFNEAQKQGRNLAQSLNSFLWTSLARASNALGLNEKKEENTSTEENVASDGKEQEPTDDEANGSVECVLNPTPSFYSDVVSFFSFGVNSESEDVKKEEDVTTQDVASNIVEERETSRDDELPSDENEQELLSREECVQIIVNQESSNDDELDSDQGLMGLISASLSRISTGLGGDTDEEKQQTEEGRETPRPRIGHGVPIEDASSKASTADDEDSAAASDSSCSNKYFYSGDDLDDDEHSHGSVAVMVYDKGL